MKLMALATVVAIAVVLGVLVMPSSDGRGPQPEPAPAKKRPNVVMLIFDEFPGDALLGRGGRIDRVRYPNFAALADDGYWFRNTWSSYDSTPKAVPLIMDGMRPNTTRRSDAKGHPRTLFDLFDGYRVHSSEEATAICPPRYCPHNKRPSIVANLGADRPKRLEAFFRTIKPGRRPGFWLKHALLPHNPYRFLPDGRQSSSGASDPIRGLNRPVGFHDEFLTRHNEQRFLLQVGLVDRLLGKLIGRLRRNGMYDNTMIVVTADHGFAWITDVPDRRRIRPATVAEIAPVPFFVKAPRQRRGVVNDSYVATLDVTPTIADLLNRRLPYRADGRSAFSRTVRKRRALTHPGTRLRLHGAHLGPRMGTPAAGRGHAPAADVRRGRDGLLQRHRAQPRPRRQGGRRAAHGRCRHRARSAREARGMAQRAPRFRSRAGSGHRQLQGRPSWRHEVDRGGGERPHRGRGAHLLPARRPRGALRGDGARGLAGRGS